jgi:hypothetical protein
MAIVINGSGTVTGLSVGGLPDGTVDAGTLATDSVVTGKIADGTIANADIADLAASKLTGALPAISGASLTGITTGKILQVVSGTPRSSDASTTTTGSWVNSGTNVNITPSSTSSKILVLQTLLTNTSNSGAYTNGLYTLQRSIGSGAYSIVTPYTSVDGGGNTYGGLSLSSYGGATELGSSSSFNHLDSPNTTSQCTYLVYYRVVPGYGTAHIKKGSTLIALEIAG